VGTEGKLARWVMEIQSYAPNFTIVERAGKHNGNADGMSREPPEGIDDSTVPPRGKVADWNQIPESVLDIALECVPLHCRIYEPFWLNGKSGEYIRSKGYAVIHEEKIDFLDDKQRPPISQYEVIVSYPPHGILKQIMGVIDVLKAKCMLWVRTEVLTRQYLLRVQKQIQVIFVQNSISYESFEKADKFRYCWLCINMNLQHDLSFANLGRGIIRPTNVLMLTRSQYKKSTQREDPLTQIQEKSASEVVHEVKQAVHKHFASPLPGMLEDTTYSTYLSPMLHELNECQKEDDKLVGPLWALLSNGSKPRGDDKVVKKYQAWADQCMLKDNCVMEKRNDGTYRIVVPTVMQPRLLTIFHNSRVAAHTGGAKMFMNISRLFTWPGMRHSVFKHVRACLQCAQAKTVKPNRAGLTQMRAVLVEPFHTLSIDLWGPVTPACDGYIGVLTVVCLATGWVELLRVKDFKTKTVAQVLMDEIFSRYGFPVEIVSDQGTQFTSNLFKDLNQFIGIKNVYGSVDHPKTTAHAERIHRFLKSLLRIMCDKNHERWADHIPYIASAYRKSVNSALRYSPYFRVFGRHPRQPTDVIFDKLTARQYHSVHEYVIEQLEQLREAYEMVATLVQNERAKSKELLDENRYPISFNIGERVLMWRQIKSDGASAKLFVNWSVAHIHSQISPVSYMVMTNRNKLRQVHVDMLVRWPGDESAKQLLSNPIDLCNLNDDDTINQEAESKQEPILPNDDRYEVDLKKGDMIIFIDEGRMWLLARVLDMETLGEPPGSLVEIHDFNTYDQRVRDSIDDVSNKTKYAPVYVTKKGLQVFTTRREGDSYTRVIDRSKIVFSGFGLSDGRIPLPVLQAVQRRFGTLKKVFQS
jgi:hypothetical protein